MIRSSYDRLGLVCQDKLRWQVLEVLLTSGISDFRIRRVYEVVRHEALRKKGNHAGADASFMLETAVLEGDRDILKAQAENIKALVSQMRTGYYYIASSCPG